MDVLVNIERSIISVAIPFIMKAGLINLVRSIKNTYCLLTINKKLHVVTSLIITIIIREKLLNEKNVFNICISTIIGFGFGLLFKND